MEGDGRETVGDVSEIKDSGNAMIQLHSVGVKKGVSEMKNSGAMAQTVGVEKMKGVSEVKSNGDSMTQTIGVGVSEIKNSGDAMTQTINNVDGIKKVREIKNDNKMNVMNEVNQKEMQVIGRKVANMEGIVKDGMKKNGGIVARVNSVEGMNVSGMIEKEDGMKDIKVENSDDIDVVVNEIGLQHEVAIKLATSETVTEEKTLIEVKEEAINNDTNIKRVDLERAGIERLAKMDRLAENQRQAKIKRREELDRVARLQRILALVRAPEWDSVAKMKQVHLEQEKEIKRDEDINVIKELGINTEINTSLDHLSADNKQLTKVETVIDEALTSKKQIKYEGIAKLERMSKEERILEIDRLVNLELAAEAKRKAHIEHAAKLEREAELERETKMKNLRELDLKAELDKAEKERLAETEHQKKMKRKEELDRIAKSQRVLVMVRASETDRVAKMKQTADLKYKEEIKLLEELGILTGHEGTEKDKARKLEPEEKANLNQEVDINLVKEVKPKTDVKEKVVDPAKGTIPKSEMKQVDSLIEVETGDNAEQQTQNESDSIKDMIEDTQKEAKKNQEAESQTNIKYEARKKRREELERVAKLQRIIATVRNTEPNGVAQVKFDIEVDKTADLKRTEEIQLFEELGIKHVAQKESGIDGTVEKLKVQTNNLNSVNQKNPDVKQVTEIKADVKISTDANAEQLTEKLAEIKMEKVVESERGAKIKRAAEMERKVKAGREVRIKRREELDRMANLQRLVALVSNEDFDHVANMKKAELKQIKVKKREEDFKVLEALGIVPRKEVTQMESETNLKTADKKEKETLTKMENTTDVKFKIKKGDIDFELANAEKMTERIVAMEKMTEKERKAVRQDGERHIAELRVAQMKRVAELGREMKQISMIDEGLLRPKQDESKQTIKTEQSMDVTNESKQIESKPMVETERNNNVTEVKRIEDKQLKFSLSEVKGDYASGIKHKKDSKPLVDLNSEKGNFIESEVIRKEELNAFADFGTPEVKRDGLESGGMKSEKELKSQAVPRLLEVKHEPDIKLADKRLSVKVMGMERVRRRDCESDGQMMYVARERI